MDLKKLMFLKASTGKKEKKNLIKMEYGKIPSVVSGQIVDAYGWRSDFFEPELNKDYVVSASDCNTNYVLFYDGSQNFIVATGFSPSNPYTFKVTEKRYIKLRSDSDQTDPKVQLEYGTTPTPYEPY